MCYILIMPILIYYKYLKFINKGTKKIINKINLIIERFFSIFNWILFVPFITIFFGFSVCSSKLFHDKTEI